MASIILSPELIKHFRISDYSTAKPGGQKKVFIVSIEGTKYALKIINIADERFKREVQICKQFDEYSGIPKIKHIELFEGDTIILEEYIEGNDLSDIISQYKNDENKTLELIYKLGKILEPVWDANYVHRDLKPQNIRIKNDGEPVVLDFGIARALNENSITATLGGQPLSWPFASPEQYVGKKELISYRTDFFCLGIIGYHLFTNKLPFGDTKEQIELAFKGGDLKIITINKKIDSFCNKVFKVNPSERPRKIETFLNILMA